MPYQSALIDDVLFVRWSTAPTSLDVLQLDAEMKSVASRVGKKYVYVSAIAPGAKTPDADARKGLSNLLKEGRKHIEVVHLILEGSELQHSLQRVIITGLLLVTRIYDDFLKVHRSAASVTPDLVARLGPSAERILHDAVQRGLVN